MNAFEYSKDADGIVTITMDMSGPVNAVNDEYDAAMTEAVDRLEAEDSLIGVVFSSAKKTFVAGGDLKLLLSVSHGSEPDMFHKLEASKALLRRIEKLPVPVVAAINGAALGGGYELCLACNRRIALNHPSAEVGLPEVTLGLLPGAGGVVRLVHTLGLEAALPFLLEGKKISGDRAVAAGLIHETVDTLDDLVPRAKSWILEANDQTVAVQPWDRKGAKIPGGNIWDPKIAHHVIIATHALKAKTRGLQPAPEYILQTAVEAVTIAFDAALRLESRKLASLVTTPQAKNMISTCFFQLNQVKAGASRPKGGDPQKVVKLGIIGAGMMGQGIAYVAAKAGIPTILTDVSIEAARKGKAYSERLLDRAIANGRMDEAGKAELLSRITPTDENEMLADCDLVIEAVFEDLILKDKIVRDTQGFLREDAVWGSNTSTLPISRLAQASSIGDKFVGIHFFSPVDKMPLVEIIRGKRTDDTTLAKAFDFVRQIKKTPIVVNDSMGFFTSRTFASQLGEAAQLVAEGVNPVRVDNLGLAIGMPVGPLTINDEVSLKLGVQVRATQTEAGLLDPAKEPRPEGWAMQSILVKNYNRGGRHHGDGGYYDYADGKKAIWPKLQELYFSADVDQAVSDQDIQDRLLFSCVIESLNCLEEGVLSSVADGNVGSLLGIGAPVWTGGYIQFVNTYGLATFIERCDELAAKYGERFKAPSIVAKKLAAGEAFV